MDYFIYFLIIVLQYSKVSCVSLPIESFVQFGGATYINQIHFHFANLQDISSPLLDGGAFGRSKSMYKTVLSIIRSFSGR